MISMKRMKFPVLYTAAMAGGKRQSKKSYRPDTGSSRDEDRNRPTVSQKLVSKVALDFCCCCCCCCC